jgi:signal transduction histidine kinase
VISPEIIPTLEDIALQLGANLLRIQAEEALQHYADRLQALSRRLVEVQEAERRHIARELHDEVGQALTGLKLLLEVIPRLPAENVPSRLDEALQLVDELMNLVHDLSLDLRPGVLDDLGLLPALLWLIERYTARTGVHVFFEQQHLEQRFPPEVETTAYRIIQEALTNIARHAGVDEAAVRLRADQSALYLLVQDAGPGFDLPAMLARGQTVGLVNMQERAALLGGWVKIDSGSGSGTQVSAALPLKFDKEAK